VTRLVLALALTLSLSIALAYLVTYLLYFASRFSKKQTHNSPSPTGPTTIAQLVEDLAQNRLLPARALARLAELLPKHIETLAGQQRRPLLDVIRDTAQLSATNIYDIKELAGEQVSLPGLEQVWVFAEHPVDLEENFYSTVRKNISERFVSYYYFQKDATFFHHLRARLISDIQNEQYVDARLHCILVHPILFVASQGFGLLITTPITHMKGKTVTRIAADGKITQAQDMDPSQVMDAYLKLRPIIEGLYLEPLSRLEHEPYPLREVVAYEEPYFTKLQ